MDFPYLFLINPKAGHGKGGDIERIVRARLPTRQIRIHYTEYPGHAIALAAEAAQAGEVSAVIAVGGDGTVSETAQGLCHTTTPLGIVPMGSGNGLARHLGISMSPQKALAVIEAGASITMDTFRINGYFSSHLSGIGFDAHVARRFSQGRRRGLRQYIAIILSSYARYPERVFTIWINDAPAVHTACMIAIANANQFGNNAYIAPDASVTDGLLNLCRLSKIPWHGIPSFVWQLFTRGVCRSPYYGTATAAAVRITTDSPVPLHVDGEARGESNNFTVKIYPHALRVFLPAHKIGCV